MLLTLKNLIIISPFGNNLSQNTKNGQILHAKTTLLRYAFQKACQLTKIDQGIFLKFFRFTFCENLNNL